MMDEKSRKNSAVATVVTNTRLRSDLPTNDAKENVANEGSRTHDSRRVTRVYRAHLIAEINVFG